MRFKPSLLAASLTALSCPALSAWTPTSDYTFASDWWHKDIKAKAAYDLNYFGQSVLVGVVDTGINTSSSEFKGRIAGCYSVLNGKLGGNCVDDNGHGSHVSGIIAAAADNKGSMGIAPQASLLVYKALTSTGGGSLSDVDYAIQLAAQNGARVINGSLGYSGNAWAGDRSYLQAAINKGALLVFAAGNDGAANPGWPARYASQSWANGQILAVGAVGSDNVITSWSNRAGDAMNYYLVAPGVGIASTYKDANYYTMSGTSMATPMVSGAAALLMSYWPKLSAQQTASILLTTATDLGAKGVDAIYGHGLLNVEAAMAPVGTLKTAASVSTRSVAVSSTVLSGSVAPAIRKLSLSGGLDTAGLDDYGRNFTVRTDKLLTAASAAPLADQLNHMFDQPALAASGKTRLAYGQGADASFSGVSSGALPYLGFNNANTLFLSNELGSGMKFGMFTSQPLSTPANGFTTPNIAEMPTGSDGIQAGATGVTLGYATGAWVFNGGLVSENAQFMGVFNSGVMRFGDGHELFASATRASDLSAHWRASASATFGLIAGGQGSGILTRYSEVPVAGYSMNLDGHDLIARHDKLAVSFGQSLKAVGGSASVETVQYDQDQNPLYSSTRIGLAQGAPEYFARANYVVPTGKRAEAGLRLEYKLNAGGVAGDADASVLLGWNTRF